MAKLNREDKRRLIESVKSNRFDEEFDKRVDSRVVLAVNKQKKADAKLYSAAIKLGLLNSGFSGADMKNVLEKTNYILNRISGGEYTLDDVLQEIESRT